MGQKQVKGGDAESPESTPFLDGGEGGAEGPSDPNTNNFDTPLHLAARRGDLEKLEELLFGNDNNPSVSDSLTSYLDENHQRTPNVPLHFATPSTSSKHLSVSWQLLPQRDKEDASFEVNPFLVDFPDGSKKTALHHAALSQEPRVVSLLLQFGADPNLKDAQGSTPLHILAESNSDSALACAELILSSPSLSPSASAERNSNGQTIVHVATLSKAPKLLRLFVERGFDFITADHRDPTYTPLIVTCSKVNGNSQENLDCVRILLGAYSTEEVNLKEEFERTVLLMAVLYDYHKILELLVASPKTDLFSQDCDKETAFHYAIYNNSLKCVKALCECRQMSKEKFVEIMFHSHEPKKKDGGDPPCCSPIEVALHYRHTEIAEYLLAAHHEPHAWMSDGVLMDFIYSVNPAALLPTMSQSLNYVQFGGHTSVVVDFRIITGAKDPVEQRVQETKYLYQIKDTSDEEQKRILLHPLVQLFIERKWERIRKFTWFHVTIQLLWVLCYTVMVYEMYAPNCHKTDRGANQTETEGNGGGGGVQESGKGGMRILASLVFIQSEEGLQVQSGRSSKYGCTPLYPVRPSPAQRVLSNDFELIGGYLRDWINYIQLGILVVAVINSVPAWQLSSASDLALWQHTLAAIGIFAAWVMLLNEMNNIPKCAVYSAILKKVLKNCVITLLVYCPLLIGFAMSLRILIPGNGQYKYLLFSLIKVVAMMAGELQFEDAFYGDDDTTSGGPSTLYNDILGQIMFLLLIFVTTIVLLNLLTGLAVGDVGKLVGEETRLFMQLERMYTFESFILMAREKLSCLDSWKRLLYRWNATADRKSDNVYVHSESTTLDITDYSAELKERIRDVIFGKLAKEKP